MAKGYIPLPDGSYLTVRDDETPEQAIARARKEFPEAFQAKAPAPEQEEGVGAAFVGGAKRMASTIGTGIEALISPEEAARKGVARSEELGQQYAPGASLEAVKKAYAERGLLPAAGEAISQIPTALAEQFPQIAATLGTAKAGAMAGQRIAGPRGALVGGIGGAVVPSLAQLFGANIERQAAEQMEAGEPVDISRTRAAAAAAPGAALEVAATFIPLGRTIVGKLLGPGAEKALARGSTEATERLAKEGLTKTLAKGVGVGAAAEIPTEIIQQMLERAQAGLPLTSEDALAEYGEAAYGAGLVGGPFGAVGRVGQRSVARGEIAGREAEAAAEERRKAAEAEQAAAEAEGERFKSAEYRLELNNTIVNSKDRLAEIEALLKSKPTDPDVKKDAIEEAKRLRKTIRESEDEMRRSMIAAGLKPDISKLEEALGKQAPVETKEPGIVYDEYGQPVEVKTEPLTDEEIAAGYEQQAAGVEKTLQERAELTAKLNRQELAEKIVEDEIRQNAPLVRSMPEDGKPAQSFVPFTSFTDASQVPKPRGMRDDVWAAMSSKDKLDMAKRDRIAAYTEALADPTIAQAINERRTDTERQKLNVFLEDEASKDQTAAEIQQRQATNQALDDIADLQIKRATDQLGLGILFLGPVRQRRVEQGVNEGKVNRYVASALEIKGLGGRTLSVDDARKNIQEAIGDLTNERNDLLGTGKAITADTQIVQPEGGLTPAGLRVAQIDVKLSELNRLLITGEEKQPSATEQELAGRLAGELEGQGDVFAPDLLKAPTSTLKGKLDEARKQSTGAFTDLVSYLDDYRAGRFFGEKGAKRDIKLASSTRAGLLRESEASRKQVVDNLIAEVATERAIQKLRPLTNAEADALRTQVDSILNELITRSTALPGGASLKEVTIQPARVRGTEIIESAKTALIDPRPLEERQFGAPRRAIEVLAEMVKQARDTAVTAGKRQTRAAYTPTFDLAGEIPRTKTRVSQEDRLLEEINRVLATPNIDPTVADTLSEAADMIANEDVSADFVELVDEQVGRILTGVDRPFAERDPTQRAKRPLEAPLIKEIRADLDAMRRGREFAQADDTMMVTQGKRFKEVETQPDLFPETKATTRATPGQFQRLQKSKEVQGKRKEIAAERMAKEKAEAELKQLERDLRAAKRNADAEAAAALEKEERNIFEEITKLAENIKRGMGDNISTINAQKFAALDDRIKKLVAEYKKKKPAVATSEVAENERILNRLLKEADTPEPFSLTSSSSAADFASSVTTLRARMQALETKIKEATSALNEVANNPEVYETKFKGLARYKKRGAAKARVEKLIEARTRFLEDAKKQLDNFELIIKKTLVQPKGVDEKVEMPTTAADLRAAKQALATRIDATLRRLKEQDTKLTEDVRGFIGLGLNLPGTRYERKSREELAKEIGEARAKAREERKAAKKAGKSAEEIAAIKTKVPSKFKVARIKDRSELLAEQRQPVTLRRGAVSVTENLKAIEQQEATAVAALQKAKKDVKDWTKQVQEASKAKDQKLFKKYEPQFYAELDRLARIEEVAQTRLETIRANKKMFSELRDVEYKTKPSPRERTTTGETKPAGLGVTEQQMYEYGIFGMADGVKIKTSNPPEFAIGDSDPTGEIDVAEAKKFLADVKAKAAKQGIKVKVYPITEVMSPDLYGASLAALGPEASKRVKGGVEPNGTVFFVIESHSTLEDLKATVAHELIGHYTFEGMLGEKGLKRLLNRLEKTHGNISKLAEKIGGQPLLRKVAQAEAMMKKLGKSDDEVRMRGLNELVAYTMEKRVDQDFLTRAKQWLQELVGAIRLGLRDLGLDMGGMSTSELFYLMRQADRNFKAGKPVARIESDGTVKYSVADSAVDNTGINKMIAQRGTYFDDAKGFATGMFGLAGRVQFLDRFAALEAVMKKAVSAGAIDSLKAFDAMYFSRMADQRNNFVAQFATGGVGKIVTKNGERMYEGGDGPSLKDVSEALTNSGVPADRVEVEFTGYIAALRAKQIPGGIKKLSTEGKVTEAEINQKIAQYANNAAFQKARKLYQEYNNNLIDFVESSGAITKELANKLKGVDYIPFYRAKGNDVFLEVMGEQPIRIGDIKNQPHLQQLLGGEKQILPIFTSALSNTSVLTDLALKNMATANTADALRMIGVAKVNKGQGPANPDVIRFKVNGQDFHAVVDTQAKSDLFGDIPTELVVQGMEGIKATLPAGIRLLGAPANWLRKFVTRDPRYAFRQIFRDSMAAAMTTGADFVPVVQTFKDMATMKKTGVLQTLQKRGVVGGQVISGAEDDMGKILQQVASGKPGWNMAMAKLDELAMMGDAATRVSMYNSFLKQGLSEREATFATLEAMNFSRRGISPSVLYANTLIPFFNAALQGLDVMYRAYKGDMPASQKLRVKQKLLARLGIMAGITVTYAALMQDDETYENANPEERYGNWFVPTPFGTLRVPIPFELGLIGKAAPEGIYRLMASDDSTGEVADALRKMALRSIPIDIPTAIKPAIEWNMNRSFFTGRDLVTASMPGDPKFQYNLNTPEILRLFGNIGLSPVKVENTLRGYTGSLGVSMLRFLDPVFGGEIVKPGQGLANVPILGGLFQPEDASGIINAAYNTANELEAISKTYKRLELEDPDEAEKYLDSKLTEIDSASDAGRFKQYMGALTKEEREIRADKTLDPKKKDEYLKELRQEKIEASKEFRQMILETKRQAA